MTSLHRLHLEENQLVLAGVFCLKTKLPRSLGWEWLKTKRGHRFSVYLSEGATHALSLSDLHDIKSVLYPLITPEVGDDLKISRLGSIVAVEKEHRENNLSRTDLIVMTVEATDLLSVFYPKIKRAICCAEINERCRDNVIPGAD
jgi:hypothetical protein